MKTIQEQIREQIRNISERLQDNGIVTAEHMIPEMKAQDFPARYKLDIAYDNQTEWEKLDIFYPEHGTGPFPVFIEVHGGAWYFGQKRSIEFAPFLYGLERGFACVTLGYTLSPQAVYPQAIEEIKSAVSFLKKNAKKFMLDISRIVLWGGSAGAQLASMAAFTGADVNILVLWYGCYDFYRDRNLEDWVYENYLGSMQLWKEQDRLIGMNPVYHVKKTAPFVILQHGMSDTVVPYMQSVLLYEQIKKIAGEERCVLYLEEACEHADAKLFAPEHIKILFDRISEHLNMEQNEA